MNPKPLTIKNTSHETHLFRLRFIALLCCLFIVVLIIIGRLVYLQLIQHHFYSTLSRQNLLGVIPIVPNRGLIFDRNGILLAKNIPSYTLAIIPDDVNHLDRTLEKLQKIISISPEQIKMFKRMRYQYRAYQPIPLKFKLTEQEVAKFYVNRYRFPGVLIETQMMRQYPFSENLSAALGYVGRINQRELAKVDPGLYDPTDSIGKMGIEKYYETWLHGKPGAEEAEINANGEIVRILKHIPAMAGRDLYLTIDSQLQLIAEKALHQESGAIVIMNPSTGEILALVSKPSYDPNPFVSGISYKAYEALLKAPQHPLYNRAIRGQFASGSTIKPFFALIGLDEGIINTTQKVYDPGWFQLPNTQHIYHDWNRGGHGWVNVTRAIEISCDIFFYTLATKMGIHRIDQVLQDFGFGQLTGVDVPEEVPGLVPTPEWKMKTQGQIWYPGDTVITGIGQGFFLVTPLQLAQAVSIIAMRGEHYQPHLLLKSILPNGETEMVPIVQKSPVTLKNPHYWDTVIEAMQGVVSNQGTAQFFGKHDFTVAAKTGTAQVYGNNNHDEDSSQNNLPKHLRDNHLFIAFAPVNNPEIAIAIVIEHEAMADKIAGEIMNAYFQQEKKNAQLSTTQSE